MTKKMPPPIECGEPDPEIHVQVNNLVAALKTKSHDLLEHNFSDDDFYSIVFRGAIEKIRGEHAASTNKKLEFARAVCNFLEDSGEVVGWHERDSDFRTLELRFRSGRTSAVAMKGCLDGNNTILLDRPSHVDEFVVWSLCESPNSVQSRNVWSGIHSRLGRIMLERKLQIDGLVVWDWNCGTAIRPCPKISTTTPAPNLIKQWLLPAPCLYAFPLIQSTDWRSDPPVRRGGDDIATLAAFGKVFGGIEECYQVDFSVDNSGPTQKRQTSVYRGARLVCSNAHSDSED